LTWWPRRTPLCSFWAKPAPPRNLWPAKSTSAAAAISSRSSASIAPRFGPRTVQKLAFPLGTHEDPTVYTSVCLTIAEFLAKLQPTSDPAGVNHLQLFLICLAGWINRNQQNAIEYLQEEVRVLREQLGKKPRFNDDQRRRLATKAKRIGLQQLKEITAIVTPRTLLGWHQRLIADKYDGSAKRSPGRPPTPGKVRELILRMAAENRTWGYTRIQGALQNLGHEIGRGTIAKVLQEAGVDPAPDRQKRTTWKEFLRTHWDVLAAADIFSVEVWTALGLVRYHVFFLIRLRTREVHIAGIIPEPHGPWMKQMARNLADGLGGFMSGCRYLIHDRASVFSEDFRMILLAVGIESVRLPARSPNLNAFAERFVRSIKESCWIGWC
jgi:putative transposase